MNTKYIKTLKLFAISILLIIGCSFSSNVENENQNTSSVETSVAATLSSNTANSLEDNDDEPSSNSVPTQESSTLQPTNTPIPSPEPTSTPTIPIINVSVDTNCRYGPGIVYAPPVDGFLVGEVANVLGKNPAGTFYYIDKGCYVWTNYVTVIAGNINALPVFTPVPTPTPLPTVWAGEWESICGISDCGLMELIQEGNQVSGNYAEGDGTIEGEIEDNNHLVGTYQRDAATGTFEFWLSDDEQSFSGNWGDAHEWCGYRDGEPTPIPCGISNWVGTWVTFCGLSNCDEMILDQESTIVSGTYAEGEGTVTGTVNDIIFTGIWTRGSSTGIFTYYMENNGYQFNGNYDNDYSWCGYKNDSEFPDPCLNN